MPSYSPEQIKPVTDERLVDQLSLPAKISLLKKQPNAPQGDEKLDFKTAVYLCACLNNFTFEDALTSNNITILSIMMASFYKKLKDDTEPLKSMTDYVDVLQELVDDGALEHLGPGLGFVCPEFKIVAEGCIGARFMEHQYGTEQTFFNGTFNTLVFSRNIVLPGDEVTVAINGMTGMATVLEINKIRNMLIMTPSYTDHNKLFVQERGFEHTTFSFVGRKPQIERGKLYIAEIVQRKTLTNLAIKIREVVNDLGSLNGYIVRATLEHNLPSSWPQVITENLDKIPAVVQEHEIKGRVDLRDLPLVTIDGEDAKDFDDAVYCEKQGNKFHLYVAIADVSYYVRPNTALDHEAILRCNSVYFPYFVIPMLPEALSNGICSLNPKVDRLCMVCDMIVDKRGEIESYKFYPAVMNSHARLTYTEAFGMIETGKADDPEKECCVPWVKTLYELYQVLKSARDRRGAFEFEGTEVSFIFDEHWNVVGLAPEQRNEAHMLIEECMIAANICAATFVIENQYDTLYRIHPRPTKEKLNNLRAILSKYGIDLKGFDEPSPRDFGLVSEQVSKLSEGVRNVIGLQLLRSMSKASYNPTNIGHFGLALENYAHFTSPIRRYPDLQLHRVIKFILEKQEQRDWGNIGARAYSKEELLALGISTTEHEIESDNAEFDVENSLKCEYVKQFVNFVVPATVSAINDYGVFVTLNDFYIDGRLTIVADYSVKDQYFTFFGGWLKNNNKFSVGDQITVRVLNAYPDTRRIDLEMAPPDKDNKAAKVIEKFKVAYPESAVTDSVETSREVRNQLFNRLSDISRGKEPSPKDIVQRQITDFGLIQKLEPSQSAKSGKDKKRQAFKQQLSDIKDQLTQGDVSDDSSVGLAQQTEISAATNEVQGENGSEETKVTKSTKATKATKAKATKEAKEAKETKEAKDTKATKTTKATKATKAKAKASEPAPEVQTAESAKDAVKEEPQAHEVTPTLIQVKRKGKVTNETIVNGTLTSAESKASEPEQEQEQEAAVAAKSKGKKAKAVDATESQALDNLVAGLAKESPNVVHSPVTGEGDTMASVSKGKSKGKAKKGEADIQQEAKELEGASAETTPAKKTPAKAKAKKAEATVAPEGKAEAPKKATKAKISKAKATKEAESEVKAEAKVEETEVKKPVAKKPAAKKTATKAKQADKEASPEAEDKAVASAKPAKATKAKTTKAKSTKAADAEVKAEVETKAEAEEPASKKPVAKKPATKKTAAKAKPADKEPAPEAEDKAVATAQPAKATKAKTTKAKSTKAAESEVKADETATKKPVAKKPAAKKTTTKAKQAEDAVAKETEAEAKVATPAKATKAKTTKSSKAKSSADKATVVNDTVVSDEAKPATKRRCCRRKAQADDANK